jgi:hypothetical protein
MRMPGIFRPVERRGKGVQQMFKVFVLKISSCFMNLGSGRTFSFDL